MFRKVLSSIYVALFGVFWALTPAYGQDSDTLEIVTVAETMGGTQSVWVGYRPASGTAYTYWHEEASAPVIGWSLPAGAELGEVLWPKIISVKGVGALRYGFAADSYIFQQIKFENAPVSQSVEIETRLAVCEQECRVEGLTGKAVIDPDQATHGSAFLAKARENALTHRPGGTMMRAGGGQLSIGNNSARNKDENVKSGALLFVTPDIAAEGGAFKMTPFVTGFYTEAPLSKDYQETEQIKAIMVLEKSAPDRVEAYTVNGRNDYVKIAADLQAPVAAGTDARDLTAVTALLFAFIGGLILNIMPCVLPVLAIKVFSLVKAGSESRAELRGDGLAYTGGILLSFAILGGLMLGLRLAGSTVGWGFQLQQPPFVYAAAILMFAVALNFLGFFEIGGRIMGLGQSLTEKSGKSGAFFTGILATILATPCTAPFMAPAIAFAIAQTPALGFSIFIALGLGLAAPYLLISLMPGLHKFFPKPGPWMVTFKEFLAFPMMATAVWLVWVLSIGAGSFGVLIVLSAFVLIALAVWLLRRSQAGMMKRGIAAVLILAALSPIALSDRVFGPAHNQMAETRMMQNGGLEKIPFTHEKLAAYRAEGRPVFVHFWAAWCIFCLMHENTVFETQEFQDYLEENNMVFLQVDNTKENPEITAYMETFGRSGQPLDVFFPGDPDKAAVVFPEFLTTQRVIRIMNEHM